MLDMQTSYDGILHDSNHHEGTDVVMEGRKQDTGKIHSPLKPKEFPNQGAEKHLRMCPQCNANHSNSKGTKKRTAKGVTI